MDQFREVARRTVRSKGDVGNVGKEMAHPKRFELLTPRFVVWCSIQLSYGCLPKEGGYIQA